MFIFQKKITVKDCESNPDFFYIFGDNLDKSGKSGQAEIRDCKNSFGVPTKVHPTMNDDAFFADREDEIKIVREYLKRIWLAHKKGKVFVLPIDRIGSGLAKLKEKSPVIWKIIEDFYKEAWKDMRRSNG